MKKYIAAFFFFSTTEIQVSSFELHEVREKYQLPAMAASYSVGDDLAGEFVAGERKWKSWAPVELGDVFHLGSCTKAMTATLLAIFIEKKKLSWSTTLSEAFPELRAQMPKSLQKVTLEMLTTHRSGLTGDLIAYKNGELWKSLWDSQLKVVDGRKLLSQQMLSTEPAHVPGEIFEYSNANYVIVAAVLEKTTGQAWEDLMMKELFVPLGMKSCGFGPAGDPLAKTPTQPWPHQEGKKEPIPVAPDINGDNPATLGPAGNVHCSLRDWMKFARMHLDGFNGKGNAVLKSSSLKKLYETFPGKKYTFGAWGKVEKSWADGPVLTHAGSNTLNFASVWIAPKKNAIFLAATNQGGDKAEKAVDEVITLLVNKNLK